MLTNPHEGTPAPFSGSYDPGDVRILLKPSAIVPTPVEQKERLIQSGRRHYSEMLSAETLPDERYMRLYRAALARNAARLKSDILHLAGRIAARPQTCRECVIVSLARAGTPIGVLLKRALQAMGIATSHYAISIIRGRGIDLNALRHIEARHGTATTVFVDGWTGKGAIARELATSLAANDLGFQPFLAVVADPAGCAHLAATTEDYVIPSGLLNGIVSGLISRSVLHHDLVGERDFHACLFMSDHAEHDISRNFITAIEAAPLIEDRHGHWSPALARTARGQCRALLADIAMADGISDINRIKPGIAEATRAILRRVPDKVYLHDPADPEVRHMIHLADRAGVPVERRDLRPYRALTIIKNIGGQA